MCHAIYASHVWEHLYLKDGEFALSECHRVLKAGGVVRIVVPPLHDYCDEYVIQMRSSNSSLSASFVLNEKPSFPVTMKGNGAYCCVYTWR
jgi:predicted SAM-dependent methyltransferase